MAAAPKVIVLDLSAVVNLEYTALKMLIEGEERMQREGVAVWLVAMTQEVLTVVQRSGLAERLGRERMFFTVEQAVERYMNSSATHPQSEKMQPAAPAV